MATGVAKGAFVSVSNYDGSWSDVGGTAYVGYTSSGYRTTVIRFNTPDYLGLSESIQIQTEGVATLPESGVFEVRYAICTSDVNRDRYIDTHSAVVDDTQVATGVQRLIVSDAAEPPTKNLSLSVNVVTLEPSTVYYLYLWVADVSSSHIAGLIVNLDSSTLIVAYNSGLVYIDTGSGFEAYKCYVDDGTSWNLCIPYVDNGSSWDMSG